MPRSIRSQKLRLGIIGTGIATNELYLPALKALRSKIQVLAVANRRKAKAVAFAARAGVPRVHANGDDLLADPDVEAVLLSLPIHLTADWVLRALRAGKHVLSEKPIAANARDGRRLIAAAKRHDRVWLVGENFFFTPHMVEARNWARSGKLGDLRLVEASQLTYVTPDNKYAKTSWRRRPQHLGGFVADGGVHLANVVRETVGMPARVHARTSLYNRALAPVDTAVGVLEFPGGALGIWKSCFSVRTDGELPMLRIYGSRANLEVYHARSVFLPHGKKPKTVRSPRDGFFHELLHFAECVRGRAELAFFPEAALADLELIELLVT